MISVKCLSCSVQFLLQSCQEYWDTYSVCFSMIGMIYFRTKIGERTEGCWYILALQLLSLRCLFYGQVLSYFFWWLDALQLGEERNIMYKWGRNESIHPCRCPIRDQYSLQSLFNWIRSTITTFKIMCTDWDETHLGEQRARMSMLAEHTWWPSHFSRCKENTRYT